MFFNFTDVVFDSRLTAIQDRDSSSGDHEDFVVKSEAIETGMMPGIVMSLRFKLSSA